jgi:hypothetical protein
MGIVMKRRDNSPVVKEEVYGGALDWLHHSGADVRRRGQNSSLTLAHGAGPGKTPVEEADHLQDAQGST